MRASILITPLAPLLASACLLAGCGQKGPLYLPPETPIRQATPAAAPSSQKHADDAGTTDGNGRDASSDRAASTSPPEGSATRATTHRSAQTGIDPDPDTGTGTGTGTGTDGTATRQGTDE